MTPDPTSPRTLRVACAQLVVSDDPARNIELAIEQIARAAARGARLVVLPEATLAPFGTDLRAAAHVHGREFDERVTAAAEQHDVIAIAGTFTPAEDGRVRNTLLVRGRGVRAEYDKIHLFDAFGTQESATIEPGETLRTVDVDGIRIGLATCYDLRFPEQFQALADRGAQVIVVPAAWADGPGKTEQWNLLVRARALDATVFLVASDQTQAPDHPDPQRGVGASLVASPLGVTLGQLGRDEDILLADLDLTEVPRTRRTLPVLEHRVTLRD